MSSRNGDKSRFHRERKQKIARRIRTHELMKAAERKPGDSSTRAEKKPVSA